MKLKLENAVIAIVLAFIAAVIIPNKGAPVTDAVFIFVISFLFWYIGISAVSAQRDKERGKALATIEPILNDIGFTSYTRHEGIKPVSGWSCNYRKRNFNVELYYPSRAGPRGGGISALTLSISTSAVSPNAVYFTNKEYMESHGMSDIYARLEKLGLTAAILPEGAFYMNNRGTTYYLAASILTKETLKESLDIICDTLERSRL